MEEVVFPGDKKARNRVHARLAKKIAAREAEKTERMSGGGDAALAAQMKQELVQLEKERTRVRPEAMVEREKVLNQDKLQRAAAAYQAIAALAPKQQAQTMRLAPF